MKSIMLMPFLALGLACTAEMPPEVSEKAQSRLAAAIEGRQEGPPESCVPLRDLEGNESAGEGAIIFRTRTNDLIYVNRPPAGCPEIGLGRALKLRTTVTQICRGDIIEVFDPVSNISYGGCGLGEFTPYRRTR